MIMTPAVLRDRFRILELLASGGFGETYLAEDAHKFNHKCVLKKLKPIANNPQAYATAKRLFEEEAKTLDSLGQANDQIPDLYAYFEEDGLFYLAQKWIEGKTLAAKVHTEGLMNETEIIHLLEKILPVLDFIHTRRHLIHRDIKPDNIIIRQSDGMPVLIDFGAVKESVSTILNSHGQPTPSIMIGTPGFMSPEQAAGRPVFSSDLYSLGITAIYLLTGRISQNIPTDPRTGELIWRNLAAGVSDRLAFIIHQAVQYHPRDRFATAQEMLNAIQADEVTIIAFNARSLIQPLPLSQPTEIAEVAVAETAFTTALAPVLESTSLLPVSQPSLEPSSQVPSSVTVSPALEPHPSLRSLKLGLLLVAAAAIAGGYWSWQELQQRSLADSLSEIRTLQQQQDYAGCIAKAQQAAAQPKLATQAQDLEQACSTARDRATLQQAVDRAAQRNANLEAAIQQAKTIQPSSPVYADAQTRILNWQAILLQKYFQNQVAQGKITGISPSGAALISKIKPTVEVAADQVTIAYDASANPKYATEQGIRVIGGTLMQYLRGDQREGIASKYSEFQQLVVYPKAGSQQATIAARSWDGFVNNRISVEQFDQQIKLSDR